MWQPLLRKIAYIFFLLMYDIYIFVFGSQVIDLLYLL